MRREDIANFLTAERRISPLMAFSLLIVAGFMAGSMQLVAPPTNNTTLMAAAASTDALDSSAPKDCTAAIKAALGKQAGPQATTVDQGKVGTADACFGGVLKDGKSPSQKTEDYQCVGRSGKVTITSDSAISITIPEKSVPQGKCQVQVCQPFPGVDPAGKPTTNPNCGEPKQFSAGQSVTPQTGGVPSIPPVGSPSTGAGGAPLPQTPAPNGSGTMPPVQDLDAKPPAPVPNGGTAADQIGNIGQPIPGSGILPESSGFGAPPAAAETSQFSPGAQSNAYLNGQYQDVPASSPVNPTNNPDSLTPVQTSTFSPGAAANPYLNGEYTPNSNQTDNPSALTPSPSDVQSLGAVSNPWLNGNIPANSAAINNPEALTPSAALEPGVQDLRGWSPGAATNPYLNGTVSAQSDMVNDSNALTPSQNSQNSVPPAQGLDSGINTQISCTDAGCTAKPVTPADTQALQRDGFSCANGSCTRPAQSGVQTNPYLNGTVKPDGAAVNNPNALTPPPGGGGGTPGGGGGGGGGSPSPAPSSSKSGSGLTSLLAGMLKGFTGALAQQQQSTGPAPTCPTDPQAYAQYQQQYNQQLQQYNYQLQQYNYQQQQLSYQSPNSYYSSYPPPAPIAPQPCQNGGGAGQCQPLTAQPAAASCPNGTWRQMTTAQAGVQGSVVCPVWQCVPGADGSGTTPTASITCAPTTVERGTPINISYSCTNAQSSTGYGFSTGGALSGITMATTTDAPDNAAGVNYAIKCENGAVSAGAQCSVQIAKVSISLRAQPQQVREGERALIGWVTTGMESCTVSSPDQPEFTDRNAGIKTTAGIATSSPITAASTFVLNCKTVTGGTKQESVTVTTYKPGTVSASIENRNDVQRGGSATIRWNFQDAPDVSAVALWLYSVEDQQTVALISGHRAKTGTYAWDIPGANDPCNTNASNVCGLDLVPGRHYQILATLYTPTNAGLGEFGDNQNLPKPVFIDSPVSQSFGVSQ